MRRIDLTGKNIPTTTDQARIEDLILKDNLWVEIKDPMNKWSGSIGKLDSKVIIAENKKYAKQWRHKQMLYNTFMLFYFCEFNMGNKSIKIKINDTDLVVLDGYTGPGVYKYTKDIKPKLGQVLDLLGNEIKPGAFVAASSGTGIFLAVVEELTQHKGYGKTWDIRARLRIVIESTRGTPQHTVALYNALGLPPPAGQDECTVAIDNLMVITPDVTQQATIARLSKP